VSFHFRNCDGYFIDGFHSGGVDGLKVDISGDVAPILKDVFAILPADRPRVYPGMCDPKMVLQVNSKFWR
jgi:hypothetical protein